MPVDFWYAHGVLGQYGWHNSEASSVGSRPELWLLQQGGSGGSFGAYSFYLPAFYQAKKSWWVHGMMKQGSDLLRAVNRNAAFDNTNCSYWGNSNGESGKDCPPPINSPVGFKVGFMHKGPEGATVLEVVDNHTLRLDKKSPGDVLQYDLAILPPDYVNMCACTTAVTSTIDLPR